MERIKQNEKAMQVLNATERHLHRIFLASAIFAALSCFSRADYNLPLYAFLYLMWDQDDVSAFTVTTECVERQSEAHGVDGDNLYRRLLLDVLLGASLLERRDEQVLVRTPLLRYSLHLH